MPIGLRYAARSDVGLVRSDNQDSGYAGPHLLAVADGMGGHAGGDIASATVITELVELDHDSLGAAEASKQLGAALRRANAEIARIAQERSELTGMGTTTTALMRARNKLILAHIGDSRAYLRRGGEVTQITTDHSFVQTLIDEGRITEDEASTHPQRSVVTRVLTGEDHDEPDVSAREARIGDRYLLCSDGLSGFVARDTIEEQLAADAGPAEVADALVALALKAGAPDNVTVIVADVVDPSGPTPPSTQPQVVGSAAQRAARTRAIPSTPAAKAAALTQQAVDDDDLELAEEGHTRRGRWLRRLAGLALVALVLGAVGYGTWAWTQQQYYIGDGNGHVTIYRGVASDLGPVSLSSSLEETDVLLSDLPDFYRASVEQTVTVDSEEEAQKKVDDLRVAARRCATLRSSGEPCGR